MDIPFVIAAIVLAVLVLAGLFIYFKRKEKRKGPGAEPVLAKASVSISEKQEPVLSQRLFRTRGSLAGRLGKFFSREGAGGLLDAEWGEVEEALLEGDVGIRTADLLLAKIKQRMKESNGRRIRELIQEESESLLANLPHGFPDFGALPKPYVISIVGVNGAGKTTTIGKLAHRFSIMGKTVLMGAGDTFRAAAISQLKVWADRSGAQFITGREGADPGAVAFDSVTAAKARGIDLVLLDTAGRLHTKTNLMDELKKVHRVVKKVIPEAPHETWLVVDGTTGQNAIQQAKIFQEALTLTGIIVTKLDGTAKGGALLAIASELKLGIRCIGVGESIEDLIPFEPKPFVEAILGGE
jgi:fused signal recognition particle receptor